MTAGRAITTTVVKMRWQDLNPEQRFRLTQDETGQLDAQLIEILELEYPQSVRHMFYRMTDPRLPFYVPKTDSVKKGDPTPNGYRLVQRRLTELRRGDRIPYGWITDATRRGYHTATYSSPGKFIQQMSALYRGDLWRQSDRYVEVWCESRSIAGVIEETCHDLAVSLYPAGGFSSLSFIFEAAENIKAVSGGRPVELVYIGDYDPAGVLIDLVIAKELRGHLPGIELTVHRIAITEEQIDTYDLPTKPRKKDDKRALHVKETVEAEGMPAGILRDLLRSKIESFLPEDAMHVVQAAEESERKLISLAGIVLDQQMEDEPA